MAILGNVNRTTYKEHTTRSGRTCLLVNHILCYGEEVKRYLFPKSKDYCKFLSRRTRGSVSNLTVCEVVEWSKIGKILPTENITFVRDGRFYKVLDEKVGSWDPAILSFMKEVKEIFGDVTVIEVKG